MLVGPHKDEATPGRQGGRESPIGQAWLTAGTHIPFRHFRGRVAVRTSVLPVYTAPHGAPPSFSPPRSHRLASPEHAGPLVARSRLSSATTRRLPALRRGACPRGRGNGHAAD